MLHLEVLEHYIEHMEVSAVAFTEILTKTDKPLDTEEVFDKCARFTFEIICKCLMGDVNNDTQTSMTFDRIFKDEDEKPMDIIFNFNEIQTLESRVSLFVIRISGHKSTIGYDGLENEKVTGL